jgi:putative FmdB family regulatory protein
MPMPTYEYRCQECRQRFEIFLTYADYDNKPITCPKCGSGNIKRLIGKVRIAKTEDRRIEEMVDPSQLSGIEDDPKALGQLMRRMGTEMGEEMDPELDEVVSRLESGQEPDQIEKEMPGLSDLPASEE